MVSSSQSLIRSPFLATLREEKGSKPSENSSLAKNWDQARHRHRDRPSMAKKWEDFSDTKKIDSTPAEQLNILQRNSLPSESLTT